MAAKNYYEVLDVEPTATAEEIKQSRRLLRAAWHPDKFKGTGKTLAEEKFKDIEQAYDVLINPQKRAEYDRGLAQRRRAEENQQQSEDQQRTQEFLFRDYSIIIANRISESFSQKYETDLSTDWMAWTRLVGHAEETLLQLMYFTEGRFLAPFISSIDGNTPIHIDEEITRENFQTLTDHRIEDIKENLVVPDDLLATQEKYKEELRQQEEEGKGR